MKKEIIMAMLFLFLFSQITNAQTITIGISPSEVKLNFCKNPTYRVEYLFFNEHGEVDATYTITPDSCLNGILRDDYPREILVPKNTTRIGNPVRAYFTFTGDNTGNKSCMIAVSIRPFGNDTMVMKPEVDAKVLITQGSEDYPCPVAITTTSTLSSTSSTTTTTTTTVQSSSGSSDGSSSSSSTSTTTTASKSTLHLPSNDKPVSQPPPVQPTEKVQSQPEGGVAIQTGISPVDIIFIAGGIGTITIIGISAWLQDKKKQKILYMTVAIFFLLFLSPLVLADSVSVNVNVEESGSIWTTKSSCGSVGESQFVSNDAIYINGANFSSGNYLWNITGQPSSCKPSQIVSSGSVIPNITGEFCFLAYTVTDSDCGSYDFVVSSKYDSFSVSAQICKGLCRTFEEIGSGTGFMFLGMASPLMILLILLAVALMFGIMFASIGRRVGGKI